MSQEDIFYKAVLTRDRRFDGKFFVGVKTTGIYCRPICPAKPKRENVEFFAHAILAEKAGYRPCLRCRPEVAPQSPAWIGTSAIVQRGLRKIQSQEALSFNEDQFANSLGVGGRHLRRLFIDEIGKTPKQIIFEQRLNLTRQLLVETALPITEVAYAAGFGSIRRFNDAFLKRFDRSPSSIRRKKVLPHQPMVLTLAYRPPFDFDRLLRFYQVHQMGNLELFEPGRMTRIICFNGQHGRITVYDDPSICSLKLEIDFPNVETVPVIIARVRRLFDLDCDPVLIANAFYADRPLAKLLQKYPGVRVPSGWDPFETAIATILGQLISVRQARRLVADLIDHYGETTKLTLNGEPVKLFPTPKAIASSNLAHVKTTAARKQTLRNFACAILDKSISLEPTQNMDDFRTNILKIKGIGPWTADYMALKVLGHTDAFPGTDLILSKALVKHPKERIMRISPWRAYAAIVLWCEYANAGKSSERK
jgi:AraC family transcriptional regulator of adaptative response / DNA-3-methyladenine glycosylase II